MHTTIAEVDKRLTPTDKVGARIVHERFQAALARD